MQQDLCHQVAHRCRTFLNYVGVLRVQLRFLSNGLSQYSTHHVEFTVKIVAKASKLQDS